MQKYFKSKHAFTMIELMITCVIIGALVCVAAPSYMTARLRGEEQKAVATLHEFAKAQKAYWFDGPEIYTSNRSDLTPYLDIMGGGDDDGDWRYYFATGGGGATFTITAAHLDFWGAEDGLDLVIDQTGNITRNGSWPY
jgi:prepilin-type N-terminal cleavage/methylation domain-containing protein